ncbi:MAG: AAA family ATPase [Nitrospirae bacterium]|nr:AAA family ATPase [Nitrospirota bacterium]
MIISVVNMKGGTGKSTVATNLAVMFAGKDDVLLIDADSQQSSLAWQRDRPDNLTPFSVIGLPTGNLHKEVERIKTKFSVIIIDGGGRITASAKAAVAVSDFILVPTVASKPDCIATQRFFAEVVDEVASIKGKVKGAILINMLKGTIFNLSGQEQIKTLGYPVFESFLSHRIVYQEAFSKGMCVAEYEPKGKASDEVRQMFNEIKGAIA